MSNVGKRFGLMIIGALLVVIGLYLTFYQEGYYYRNPAARAGIVVLMVGALFIIAGLLVPIVRKDLKRPLLPCFIESLSVCGYKFRPCLA